MGLRFRSDSIALDTKRRGEAQVIVGGLAMNMVIDHQESAVIGGPMVACALGAWTEGARPIRLLGGVPEAMSNDDHELLTAIDPACMGPDSLVRPLSLEPLRWIGPSVVGDDVRAPRVLGNPSAWTSPCPQKLLEANPAAFANGDPRWLSKLLAGATPCCVLVGLHGDWIPYREKEIGELVGKTSVLCLTKRDAALLSPEVRSRLDRLTIVITDGPRGVDVMTGARRDHLPAPVRGDDRVRTDVGAGDVLLGCLSAHVSRADAGDRHQRMHEIVCQGYRASDATLGTLLSSGSFGDFVMRIGVLTRRQACDSTTPCTESEAQ